MKMIKIGTRKSRLALWQAEYVARKLEATGVSTELITMETKGDKVLDVSISKIGSKGVFTEELEEKLAIGEIDIAVHSAKDMQSRLPEGFELIAFSTREKANDVIVSDIEIDLSKPLTIGTSSTRRIALLKYYYPHIETVDIRGNLQTRIEKMRSGLCDALLLAYAGVHRMEYDDMIRAEMPFSQFIPPVGQGSIAIEAHCDLTPKKIDLVRKTINDTDTENVLLAERAFLRTVDGGCSIPVFAMAEKKGNQISIEGGIVSLDGKQMIRRSALGKSPEQVGVSLAQDVLDSGGDVILKQIKLEMT
ncbi:MAG: hydroxymethylbilane synthase [Cyclobacteriaceae bacterium]|nr:hydroxymethylbilane synthase [Cyclobacteriaceae bacterium HetDA_MAG_MS6]